ncbi:hypothetical protein SAMN05444148_0185 [Winogradskyella jejuensis]|uniref:Uncharacterized protein n=1 Tax=Winogradskyella jejuensis TaxID=1089305 RepID=A0A1M5JZ36_9FLAO|nr:hypothetical protein SAMN05444148_0185 [Winogradskyella jejuensis]
MLNGIIRLKPHMLILLKVKQNETKGVVNQSKTIKMN